MANRNLYLLSLAGCLSRCSVGLAALTAELDIVRRTIKGNYMLGAVVLLFQIHSSAEPGPNDWSDALRVIEQAQRWREGNRIPEALRRFRQSDGCFGSPMDTAQLLGRIENLQLLVALTLNASERFSHEFGYDTGTRTGIGHRRS